MKFRLKKNFKYDGMYSLQKKRLFGWKEICTLYAESYESAKNKADKKIEEYILNDYVWEVK